MTHKEAFNLFWKLYPQRNGKKIGKYPCELWFEAKRPSDEVVETMINWLKTDADNREIAKDFYANLPDPIRFLKNRMWKDPIQANGKKRSKFSTDCCLCESMGVATYKRKWYCGKHLKEQRGY